MPAASRGIMLATHGQPLVDTRQARLTVHHPTAKSYTAGAASGMAVWDFSTREPMSQPRPTCCRQHLRNSPRASCEQRLRPRSQGKLDQANGTAQASGCFGVPWIVVEETFLVRIGWSYRLAASTSRPGSGFLIEPISRISPCDDL